jgi:hypothetical protein
MKITLGYRESRPEGLQDVAYGTIEVSSMGLQLSGDEGTLQRILEQARRNLPAVRQVRLARRTGPYSDTEVLRYLLKTSGGMTSWFEIEDTAAKEAFSALTASYMAWDRAWSETIHTTGLRGISLLYGLPGDVEYLHWYEQRYGSQMTPEQRRRSPQTGRELA